MKASLVLFVLAFAAVALAQDGSSNSTSLSKDLDLDKKPSTLPNAATPPPQQPPQQANKVNAQPTQNAAKPKRRPLQQVVYVTVNKNANTPINNALQQQQQLSPEERKKLVEADIKKNNEKKDEKKDSKLSLEELKQLEKKDARLVRRIRAINEQLSEINQRLHTDESLYQPKRKRSLAKQQERLKKLRTVRRKLLESRPQRADPPKATQDNLKKLNENIKGVLVKLAKKDLAEKEYKSLVSKLKDLRKNRVEVYQAYNKQPIIAARRTKPLKPSSNLPLPSLVKKGKQKTDKKNKKDKKKDKKKKKTKKTKKSKKVKKPKKVKKSKKVKKPKKVKKVKRIVKKKAAKKPQAPLVKAKVVRKKVALRRSPVKKFAQRRQVKRPQPRMIVFTSKRRPRPPSRRRRRLSREDDEDDDQEDYRSGAVEAEGPNASSLSALDDDDGDSHAGGINLLPETVEDEALQYLDALGKDDGLEDL